MPSIHRIVPALSGAALVVVTMGSPSMAQRANTGPLRENEVLVHPADLASHPDVQKDLALDDAQKASVARVVSKMREEVGEALRARNTPLEVRRLMINTSLRKAESQVNLLLKPDQLARMEQIRLQQDGYVSLARPEIARKIDIDGIQGSMVRQGAREMYRYQQQLIVRIRHNRSDLEFEDIPQQLAKIKKEFNAKLEKILTAAQKARWQKLVGKPLPLELVPRRFTTEPLETIKERLVSGDAILLDVREQAEWDEGHVEGAVLLPLSEMSDKDNQRSFIRKLARLVPKDRIVYCYCSSGRGALIAAAHLDFFHYDVRALKAGYLQLIEAGFPTDGQTAQAE